MKTSIPILVVLLLCTSSIFCQKVGINQQVPSEPLEVGGIIFTNQGGVKFPDSTIQTTAAFNSSIPDTQILQRSFVVLELDGFQGNYSNNSLGISDGIILLSAATRNSKQISCISGGSNPLFSHISCVKNMDALSFQFFQRFAQGQVISDATIYFLELDMNGNLKLHTEWELDFVQIAEFNTKASYSSSAGYNEHLEEFNLFFKVIKFISYDVNGPSSFTFDVCGFVAP